MYGFQYRWQGKASLLYISTQRVLCIYIVLVESAIDGAGCTQSILWKFIVKFENVFHNFLEIGTRVRNIDRLFYIDSELAVISLSICGSNIFSHLNLYCYINEDDPVGSKHFEPQTGGHKVCCIWMVLYACINKTNLHIIFMRAFVFVCVRVPQAITSPHPCICRTISDPFLLILSCHLFFRSSK